jgi:hypothetical protein
MAGEPGACGSMSDVGAFLADALSPAIKPGVHKERPCYEAD